MGLPIRDTLVYRELSTDGSVWDIKRVTLLHLAAHVEAGWIVLISTAQLRAIEAERFNPPHPPR